MLPFIWKKRRRKNVCFNRTSVSYLNYKKVIPFSLQTWPSKVTWICSISLGILFLWIIYIIYTWWLLLRVINYIQQMKTVIKTKKGYQDNNVRLLEIIQIWVKISFKREMSMDVHLLIFHAILVQVDQFSKM